jgi:hypothetical protein
MYKTRSLTLTPKLREIIYTGISKQEERIAAPEPKKANNHNVIIINKKFSMEYISPDLGECLELVNDNYWKEEIPWWLKPCKYLTFCHQLM